jgi:hypothetical protein
VYIYILFFLAQILLAALSYSSSFINKRFSGF